MYVEDGHKDTHRRVLAPFGNPYDPPVRRGEDQTVTHGDAPRGIPEKRKGKDGQYKKREKEVDLTPYPSDHRDHGREDEIW